MKIKRLFVIAIAAALLAATALFSVSSSATAPDFDKLTLKLSVPSSSVANGGTFDVAVAVANSSVSSYKIAGLQVQLDFDPDKLTASVVTPSLDTTESTAYFNINSGNVKFVCVKNDFSASAGYTSLSSLFTVRFTAKTAISDPTSLFKASDLNFLVGDVDALKIDSDGFYGGNAEQIALLLLDSDLSITLDNEDAGSILIIPTPSGTSAKTSAQLSGEFSDTVSVTTANGTAAVGTGSVVSYNGETVTVIVAGDIDGDGIVTVYDANIICKAGTDVSNPALSGAPKASSEMAGSGQIINHVVGTDPIG